MHAGKPNNVIFGLDISSKNEVVKPYRIYAAEIQQTAQNVISSLVFALSPAAGLILI